MWGYNGLCKNMENYFLIYLLPRPLCEALIIYTHTTAEAFSTMATQGLGNNLIPVIWIFTFYLAEPC